MFQAVSLLIFREEIDEDNKVTNYLERCNGINTSMTKEIIKKSRLGKGGYFGK
jgi:hypothetical protein